MKFASKTATLHVHITSLFVTLIFIFGLILAIFNYRQSSSLIIDASHQVVRQTDRQIEEHFETGYKGSVTLVELLAQSNLAQSSQLGTDIVPARLKQVLSNSNGVEAIYIAYENGDYLYLSRLPLNQATKPQASYLLKVFQQPSSELPHQGWTVLLDAQGQPLDSTQTQVEVFDPRARPWYQQAAQSDAPILTQPYLFKSLNIMGITLAKQNKQSQAIVALDYSMERLSHTIASRKATPNSLLFLVNQQQELIASSLIDIDTAPEHLAQQQQVSHPIIPFMLSKYSLIPQHLDFEFADHQWLGEISEVQLSELQVYYLISVSPSSELLENAYLIRNQTLLITLAIILLVIPIAWLVARYISSPIKRLTKELDAINNLDFSQPISKVSYIKEVIDLATSAATMKTTVSQFQALASSMLASHDINHLAKQIIEKTTEMSHAQGGIIYLASTEQPELFRCESVYFTNPRDELTAQINQALTQQDQIKLSTIFADEQDVNVSQRQQTTQQSPLDLLAYAVLDCTQFTVTWIKLRNHSNKVIGFCGYLDPPQHSNQRRPNHFIQALAGYSALALEGQQLLQQQTALLESFIELIAGAIDSKSPYTGGHCSRVPELTKMLTRAACDQRQGAYQDFQLTTEQWQELHIAAWLHDCGKIVTPEYVVDKATKLETIYDRIHEVRMRFELLKQQAHSQYWQGIAQGGDCIELAKLRDDLLQTLDKEFEFVAQCNIGGEFMSDDKIAQLQAIAQRTWTRTLDDRLGVGEEELRRKPSSPANLPVQEPLLMDKPEHLFTRQDDELTAPGNPWGFNMDTPQYRFNRGELHNLSIKKGTLTEEERFIINSHMVHTHIMLTKLPFPEHLKQVPLIASSHHEKMDGQGYPKKVPAGNLPLTARIMVIADIFEALTAADRPYKKAKSLSESIKIMSFMVKDQHIDPELFKLFLSSGVYLQYAQTYLQPQQIDQVDIAAYL
ncbi:HD domain-containing phosphohydrolase [Motilimonas eburnea]|uniref:HD domain-containing phosphohydrolase n=1 Tax=Motilimonas eburnea TaxID=1737488 RepID=UPI001E5AD49E|nr:metal-dependent phosphohydrolase [Motilimonas eburnea]